MINKEIEDKLDFVENTLLIYSRKVSPGAAEAFKKIRSYIYLQDKQIKDLLEKNKSLEDKAGSGF